MQDLAAEASGEALEFLAVGASAVQVGTASFYNPRACEEIVDGIAAFLAEHAIADINDFIGTFGVPSASEPGSWPTK